MHYRSTRTDRTLRLKAGATALAGVLKYENLRILHRYIADKGLRAAPEIVASRLADSLFDVRHGLDTTTPVDRSRLTLTGPHARDAVGYAPTGRHEIQSIFDSLPLREDDVLVDYGCGKGRVLLVAYTHRFKRIVGVELSRELSDIARTNVGKYCRHDPNRVEVVTCDAATHQLRDDETVFFLYNPFGPAVIDAALQNICESLHRRNRCAWLIYVNPKWRGVVDRNNAFWLERQLDLPRANVLVYRAQLREDSAT